MTIITTYICDICKKHYDTMLSASECEMRGIPPSRFGIGDTVYFLARYHENPDRPFGQRRITDVYTQGHDTCLVLDQEARVGKDNYIGNDTRTMAADFFGESATDADLYALGDEVECHTNSLFGQKLTVGPDTIDDDL